MNNRYFKKCDVCGVYFDEKDSCADISFKGVFCGNHVSSRIYLCDRCFGELVSEKIGFDHFEEIVNEKER